LGKIDVSVAYAVWAAMGTSIVSLAGMTLFGEKCDPLKLVCLSLIILGVVGLNLQDGHK
jgi:multidrug transporter EmrE-like cation transporter